MIAGLPILQFSHANGFPAQCYRVFLDALAGHFDIRFVARFGHDPRHPVTDGWPRLVDELIEALQEYRRPVVAVGHSLGGYLSIRAAARRPDLVRGVIALDAPILSRLQGGAIAFTKLIGVADRFMPGQGTRRRRRHWPSREAALAHFRVKPVFRRFDPRCLDDYVTFGTEPDHDGLRLRFDPEIEHRIYRTFPHDMVREVARLTVPAGLVTGARSDIAHRVGAGTSARWMQVAQAPGGHLFPFQHPEAAARAVLAMATRLGLSKQGGERT